MIDLTLDINWL